MENKKQSKKPEDLAQYLTLFKIEGHTTWRINLNGDKKGFSRYIATDPKFPKITDIMVYRIDRITGKIELQDEE